MAEGFINIAIESDPDILRESVYARIKEQFPEWDPAKAVLDKFIVDGCALIGADLGDIAGVVPEEILRQFGETIYKIPALLAEPATGVITIKVQDNAGYPTIKAGTQMMFTKPDGNKTAFRTQADVEVPVGATEITEVGIEAIEPGAENNQLDDDPQLLDSVSYVTELIQTTSNTSGGRDAETPEEYLDRLTVELELLSTSPIIPSDYEKLTRRLGMYRAVAIDGWDPEAETDENERMVAVAMVDEEGEQATEKKKEEYKAEAESKREVNFIVWVIDPTYTSIDVEVKAQALKGFTKEQVEEQIEIALENFLAKRNWANNREEPRSWRQNTVVRWTELVTLVENVQGVDYITKVKSAKEGGSKEEKDIALPGKAALTEPGTFVVEVTEAT